MTSDWSNSHDFVEIDLTSAGTELYFTLVLNSISTRIDLGSSMNEINAASVYGIGCRDLFRVNEMKV